MNYPICNKKMKLVEYMYLDYKDSYQELAYPYYECAECDLQIDKEEVK